MLRKEGNILYKELKEERDKNNCLCISICDFHLI